MSHEEPDLEVPGAKLLKDDLATRGDGPPPPGTTEIPLLERPEQLRGALTAQSIIAG